MAQNSLGMMYDLGKGVPEDAERGNDWYKKAAEQGDAEAMHNLGINYAYGKGVPKDMVEAFKWLDLARWSTQFATNMKIKWTIRHDLDDLKQKMTNEEIRQGEERSRVWSQAWIEKSRKK